MSVYAYASVCDFVCIALLSPFVLGSVCPYFFFLVQFKHLLSLVDLFYVLVALFFLSLFLFFHYLKKFFLIIIFYFNNFILFYFILFYFHLSFFPSFLPFILSRVDDRLLVL